MHSEHNFTKRSGEGGPFLQAETQEQAESCAGHLAESAVPTEQGLPASQGCLSLKVGAHTRLGTALFIATSRAFLDWIWLQYPDSIIDVSQVS